VTPDSDGALRVLRDAVEQHRSGCSIDDLKRPLRRFCADARREQMPPEQALVRLKSLLDDLAAFDGNHPAERRSDRDQIISLAIKTYYSDGKTDGN
jgi:hypothetical protein